MPVNSQAIAQLAMFFGILTPGMEKALRAGFGLEPNPKLEDVCEVPHTSAEQSAALLLTVRDRIRLAFPSHIDG